MTADEPMSTPDSGGLRGAVERLAEYERAWSWNEATDDTLAGWGYHMGQMLYRLPRDSQTEDMQECIEAMLADLKDAYAVLAAHPEPVPTPDSADDANRAPVTGGLDEGERSWGITRSNGATVYAEHAVERILAARDAAWVERLAAVEAERDEAMAVAMEGGALIRDSFEGERDVRKCLATLWALALGWANQQTDYDEDTEQQIEDGRAVLAILNAATSNLDEGADDGPCESCGRQYPPWWASHAVWNRVMGGPEATGDPGGLLCSTCFMARTGKVRGAWHIAIPADEPAWGKVEMQGSLSHARRRAEAAEAERDTARREAGERIAQAIEALDGPMTGENTVSDYLALAARIARADALTSDDGSGA